MKTIFLLSASALLVFLLVCRVRARLCALATLRGYVDDFLHSKHPEGCIDACNKVEKGLEIWEAFRFRGRELRVGNKADYCSMGIDSLEDAINTNSRKKHLAELVKRMKDDLVKLKQLHRSLSEPEQSVELAVPAHA